MTVWKCKICGDKLPISSENEPQSAKSCYLIDNNYWVCNDCHNHFLNGGIFKRDTENSILENPIVKNWNIELQDVFMSWLEYKVLKNEKYTERGLKSLITQIENNKKITSESIVCTKINNSIKNNWIGICWELSPLPKELIDGYFELTWELVPESKKINKELARKTYSCRFRNFNFESNAKKMAGIIWQAYQKYLENLKDIEYCKDFSKWIEDNVSTAWNDENIQNNNNKGGK